MSPPNPFPRGLLLLLNTSALLLLLPLLLIPLMILFDFKPHTVSPLPYLPCRFLWKWFQVQVFEWQISCFIPCWLPRFLPC